MLATQNTFTTKHFAGDQQQGVIWRTINSKDDVAEYFNLAQAHIEQFRNTSSKDISPAALEEIERDLAKVEIALRRVAEFNEVLFGYGDEEKIQLLAKYLELSKKLVNL